MHHRFLALSWLSARLVGILALVGSRADPVVVVDPAVPPAVEVTQALARLRVAPGFQVSVWAEEPLVQNLTSISFDDQGRAYCVETGRRRTSVFDIRGFHDWLDDDYALRTVEQRAEFLRGMLNTNAQFLAAATKGGRGNFKDFNGDGVIDARDLEVESERIRRVWDADGDGRADHAETFADGYTNVVSGVAAGVLARGTNVWFTSIPDLWQYSTATTEFTPDRPAGSLAEKASSTGPAPGRRLLTGFGVHIAFGGHDLHGLILGPDGRLYFSIADRGSHVTSREGRTFDYPDTGAVFRCDPDGANFAVYAYGFRNPQELAFDADGQLWTADNNGDGGDKARLLPVIAGADHGWQIGWQWLPKMGPWNSERLWHLAGTNSAAYLIPAVAHVGHGPAGFAYYPGTGLGSRFEGSFFLADFPGGIRTFSVQPRGAGWEIEHPGAWLEDNSAANFTGKLLWDLSPVDVTFPPFGGVMVADWVQGWDKTGKGRLWHVTDPALKGSPVIAETRRLLGEGMRGRSIEALGQLLGHADLRVRQEAHFALAERAPIARLGELIRSGPDPRARLHALWALDIAVRQGRVGAREQDKVIGLLGDSAGSVRREAARLLGEWRLPAARTPLVAALADSDLRVQAAAWGALGGLGIPAPGSAFERVEWRDSFLFQAVVGHLQKVHGEAELAAFARHTNVHARLAAVIALRRRASSSLAGFLDDSDPQVVLETVRAIHDLPLINVLERLPSLPEKRSLASCVWREGVPFSREEWQQWITLRAINAALLLGRPEHARQLARWGAQAGLATELRADALTALALWSKPLRRDRIVGVSRPKSDHDPAPARAALAEVWAPLLENADAAVVVAALNAAQQLALPQLTSTLAALGQHADSRVRAEVARLLRARQPVTIEDVKLRLAQGSVRDQQAAFAELTDLPEAVALPVLQPWMDRLLQQKVPGHLESDILDAAAQFPALKASLARWNSSLATNDILAPFRPALTGGDAVPGRRLFAERADLGCQRCHKLRGEGGDVGPDLTGIGRSKGREYVLRALVAPDAEIAAGFESLLVTLKSGETHAGVVKSDTAQALVLDSPGEGRLTLAPAEIVSRERSPSPMPAGLVDMLSRRELRDLLEALAE